MERENQRIAITKRLLKESILRLLKEKELDKISVSELCKEAQINRATFYRHYAIPRDVLMDIQTDLFHQLKQQLPMPKTMVEFKPALYAFCAFLEQNSELLRIIIRCNSDTDFLRFVSDVFQELWKELQMETYVQLSKESVQLLTIYIAGGSYFILRSWMLGDIRKSSTEMADYIFDLLSKMELLTYGRILGFPEK